MLGLDDAYGDGSENDIQELSESPQHPSKNHQPQQIQHHPQQIHNQPQHQPQHQPHLQYHPQQLQHQPQYYPPQHQPIPNAATRPRRQVRFVNDNDTDTTRHRFARVGDGVSDTSNGNSQISWLEKNKTMVTVVACITLLLLVVVLVFVVRKKQSTGVESAGAIPRFAGGEIPAYVGSGEIPAYVGSGVGGISGGNGGMGWESASNYGAPPPVAYY